MGILFLESFCVDFFADLCTGQGVKESIKDAFNDKVRISFAYLKIFGQFFKRQQFHVVCTSATLQTASKFCPSFV